jgi:hypothetical protein
MQRGRCREAATLSWALHQPGLTPYERVVLVHLVDVADPRTGHVDERDGVARTIAAAVELPRSTVLAALVVLADLGLIRRLERPGRPALVTVAVPAQLSPTARPDRAVDNSNRAVPPRGVSPTARPDRAPRDEPTRSTPSSPTAPSVFWGTHHVAEAITTQPGLPGVDDLAGNRAQRRRTMRARANEATAARFANRRQAGKR